MDGRDYPVDVRADYPQRSSRLWAVLTIFWIKALALIPHVFILVFLSIAQFFVALIAQFVVAFKGEYPAGMHDFVTGVLRWQTRVTAFFLTVDDRYPPFTLQPVADYPVDVVAQRAEQPSRTYAFFTIIVEILALIGGIWLLVWLIGKADTSSWFSSDNGSSSYRFNAPNFSGGGGLLLRQLAAIPHYFVLAFLGIAAFVLWFVVQWVILFVARFPYGMWDIVAGYVRWATRVNAYALGLVDRYPPFSMSPSVAGGPGAQPSAPPPPPMTETWPQAPGTGTPQPPAPPAPMTPTTPQGPPPTQPPTAESQGFSPPPPPVPGEPSAPAQPEPPRTPPPGQET
jgi:hypothetical protein